VNKRKGEQRDRKTEIIGERKDRYKVKEEKGELRDRWGGV
jgi:hypothetical protein